MRRGQDGVGCSNDGTDVLSGHCCKLLVCWFLEFEDISKGDSFVVIGSGIVFLELMVVQDGSEDGRG